MYRDAPLPPFGTDLAGGGGAGYFRYGAPPVPSRPLSHTAGAFNGGGFAQSHRGQTTSSAAYGAPYSQRAPFQQGLNPISWRRDSPSSSSLLPPVAGASASASADSSRPPSRMPPSSSPAPPSAASAHAPMVNLHASSASRARALGGGSSQPFSPFHAPPAPAPAVPQRFHRTRSSFIPNKWARGPGDGTFQSIYLAHAHGGASAEFAARSWGGGPNLSFDRKRPEEIWEEEQARKRGQKGGEPKRRSAANSSRKPKAKKKDGKARAAGASKEAAARKLLARARNQLLAFLASPDCRLFSEADHVVAVSDDDLDDLLRAGGGDAGKVVGLLAEFDEAQRRFDSFQQLMGAIVEARKQRGDHGRGTEDVDAEQPATASAAGEQEEKQANGGESYRSEDDFVQEPLDDAEADVAAKSAPAAADEQGKQAPVPPKQEESKEAEQTALPEPKATPAPAAAPAPVSSAPAAAGSEPTQAEPAAAAADPEESYGDDFDT